MLVVFNSIIFIQIFVHGCIRKESMGFIPSKDTLYGLNPDLRGRELASTHSVQVPMGFWVLYLFFLLSCHFYQILY